MEISKGLLRTFELVLGRVLPWLGAKYLRLAHRCIRWQWIGADHMDALIASKKPFIVTFWHGRIIMMTALIEKSALPVNVVISANRDGELIAKTIGYFGADTIRGSSRDLRKRDKRKGAIAVLRQTVERLKDNQVVTITPDGPRGPRMRAKIGIASIAAQAGVPVIPLAYATKTARTLNSWDRFQFPLPFGRGCFVAGEALYPPDAGNAEALEEFRLQVENALNVVTERADREVGRAPVRPAAPV